MSHQAGKFRLHGGPARLQVEQQVGHQREHQLVTVLRQGKETFEGHTTNADKKGFDVFECENLIIFFSLALILPRGHPIREICLKKTKLSLNSFGLGKLLYFYDLD